MLSMMGEEGNAGCWRNVLAGSAEVTLWKTAPGIWQFGKAVTTTIQWWAKLVVGFAGLSILHRHRCRCITLPYAHMCITPTCFTRVPGGCSKAVSRALPSKALRLCGLSHLPHEGIIQVLEHWSPSSL